jgi:endogenous inhibitor of DNA gyrase (YacG/DUF329 family)
MARRKQESILLFAPDLEELKGFAEPLNTEFFWFRSPVKGGSERVLIDYRPVQKELRRLVQAWFDSGPNLIKLFNSDPIVAREAQRFRAHMIPTSTGRAKLDYLTAPEKMNPAEPLAIALGLFLDFLLNPFNERLGGPCANCGKYYVKKTKRKKTVYCSERCGHRVTSRLANKERREREHNEQLDLAKRWSMKWSNTRTAKPWKEWVSKRTHIKKHWLTRAVRNGELVEPVKPN